MSKKTLIYCMVIAAAVLSFLQINVSKQEQSELTKANIEALSFNINEWWNSKDYVCVPATCWCMFVIKYQSEIWSEVDEGTGTKAHRWDCIGCGDCVLWAE